MYYEHSRMYGIVTGVTVTVPESRSSQLDYPALFYAPPHAGPVITIRVFFPDACAPGNPNLFRQLFLTLFYIVSTAVIDF